MDNKMYQDCLPEDFWDMKLYDCHMNNHLDAYSILARGFWCCKNKIQKGKILLTGINPSYDGEHYGSDFISTRSFAELAPKDKKNGFWKKKEKQFGKQLWNDDVMSYLDLFPIRESNQRHFEKSFDKDDHLRDLRRKILQKTQDIIEKVLKPKMIIHANRESSYYWGLIDDAPWMGYKFELVNPAEYDYFPKCMNDERLRLFPFYKITGFTDDTRRINKEMYPNITHLEGCFFMEYVMEYRKKEDQEKMYNPKDWEEIWKWVQDHYAESHK